MRQLLTCKESDVCAAGEILPGQLAHDEARCKNNCRSVQTWPDVQKVYSSFRPLTAGHQQSPIDISSSTTSLFKWNLPELPFQLHYPNGIKDACKLVNTGHTWKVLVEDERFCESFNLNFHYSSHYILIEPAWYTGRVWWLDLIRFSW